MDILKVFNEKLINLGEEEVCKLLDQPKQMVRQFVSGAKTPGYKTCQKIIDLWSNGHAPASKIDEVSDGSAMEVNASEDGCLNLSYTPPEWGKKKALWPGRDVCLCIPVYGRIPFETYFTHMAMAMKYKMGMRLEARGRDSMIARSRNHLAKRFLDSESSWSIWFDVDMVFPFGHGGAFCTMTGIKNIPANLASLETIERLTTRGRNVVGGCYWDRNGSGKLIAGGGVITSPIPSDRLVGVGFVGTGCLAVHRQVYLDIVQKFPETLHPDSMGNECGFFTPIQTPQRMMGEDESFAWRATQCGHPSFLDLGLVCGHIGETIHGIPHGGSKI